MLCPFLCISCMFGIFSCDRVCNLLLFVLAQRDCLVLVVFLLDSLGDLPLLLQRCCILHW